MPLNSEHKDTELRPLLQANSSKVVDENGNRFYGNKLTQIEKGELLSISPTIQKAGIENKTPISDIKDKRLLISSANKFIKSCR